MSAKEEFEREPDVLDQASRLTQTLNDAYVGQARLLNAPQQKQNADGSWPITECVDCDDPIPAGRLALARIRCIHCQEDVEREGRQR